jgi:hypothetical protein
VGLHDVLLGRVPGLRTLGQRNLKLLRTAGGAAVAHSTGEKELLEALRREGEISSTRAAMETSLSGTQADAMLKEFAEAGHLKVRVWGGGLFYSFWEQIGYFAPEICRADLRESSKKTS